ncbi:hypothetical protein CAC42_3445 [Sphaceloma murrayae]|uniref:Vacuolar protein sorting-associated protein 54 n=1 Tax=Sphaceloma murrayae TaxID=2082308 RepID=A0A2K1R1E0_9PEZI|nr:hypothetical protein CAC42_3445 [Sphaceloma murrayae]
MSSSNRRSIDSLDSALSPLSAHVSYPFPGIESSQRPVTGSRTSSIRRGSNASIASTTNSIGGSLDLRPLRTDLAVKELGQNAISTLLQPPIVRTGLLPHSANVTPGYRAPTTRDIPPVTLTNVPHIEPSAFKDYLTKIGPLYDSINRRREDKDGTAKAGQSQEDSSAPGTPIVDRPARPATSRQGSVALLTPLGESPSGRRRSSGYSRRKPNEPTPLSTVPNVYFEEDFHLENPRTFDIVSERAEIVRPAPGTVSEEKSANGAPLPPRKALATNAILQEKLSWYMDTVEVHLINSISTASSSFFAALGSLRDLQHEAEESAARIQALRADLADLDRGMALGGLEISRMRQRRKNIGKLYKATEQVQKIVDQVIKCEEFVESGNFEEAADGIDATDRLICGRPETTTPLDGGSNGSNTDSGLYDLRELRVLQSLTSGVRDLHFRIGRGFESRFIGTLLKDLRDHVERVPANDTVKRWANASQRNRGDQKLFKGPPLYLDTGQEFRQALSGCLSGLERAGHTGQAADAFRDVIMKEMKALIRKHLPSSSDEDAESVTSVATRGGRNSSSQEKSAILARNLRALDDSDSEALIIGVCTDVSEALRRLSAQVKVLLDVTSSSERPSRAASPELPSSPIQANLQSIDGHLKATNGYTSPLGSPGLAGDLIQALDMSSLLGQAVDVAQTQITRVLKVRAEQTHKLPLERFVRYYTLLRFFADECEAISGRSGQVLKNILNTQLTAFVSNLAETESQNVAQQLESDQWEAQDFQDKDQIMLSRILDGMNSDPEIWTRGIRVWEDGSSAEPNGQAVTNGSKPEAPADGKKSAAKAAYIDDTRFILVASATALLPKLDMFLALVASVPNIAPTVVPALSEVLRTFNSRSSQLILGAGATRVSGLKNITTKHLALSSQALSFVVSLTPYIREAVRRHVGGRTDCLAEFDKVKRLFQDHQMGIHDKLVEIMTARAKSHCAAMRKIEFDGDASDEPSKYMETLTKETGTLCRVLNRHLTEIDVASIMSQIAKSYREVWLKGFEEVQIGTAQGKQRLLRDAELFDSRLSKIEGFGDIAEALLADVKGRKVETGSTVPDAAKDEGPNGKEEEAKKT